MTERPILFSGPLVRAILEGRKTQTRRVVKPQPMGGFTPWKHADGYWMQKSSATGHFHKPDLHCPYGAPGDRLYVREAFRPTEWAADGDYGVVQYRADGLEMEVEAPGVSFNKMFPPALSIDRWRPSIHMPRWASRLILEVVSVRAERLQAITYDDVEAEGVDIGGGWGWVQDWADLWDSINAKRGYGWDSNPWVWVVEFKTDGGAA